MPERAYVNGPAALLAKRDSVHLGIKIKRYTFNHTPKAKGRSCHTGSLLLAALARRSGQVHVSQQTVHDLVECRPGCLTVALVAYHQ